ncbi:streptavidin-like isoform X1 [Mercenaria mercenaria]|uniref:streptavidin-like isoform X1 n=1 Tax=Mercenaria mercenaria TaxID=6596 RepID=UPI00234EFFF9|nr:streptavidin-like isoform X1 [Mercenaria mercenaria]
MHFPDSKKTKYEIKEKGLTENGCPVIEQPLPSKMDSCVLKIVVSVVVVVLLTAAVIPTVVLATQNADKGPQDEDDCQTIPMKPNECGLAGKWKNQLKSEMEIICQNGKVTGKYNTAVGRASNYYHLVGRYTRVGTNFTDTILGWSVSWNNDVYGNSNSTTSWTGIHYRDEGIIHTHWILVRYHNQANLWQTNMIGHDDFHRIC